MKAVASRTTASPSTAVSPRLMSLGTALPDQVVDQQMAREVVAKMFASMLGTDPRRWLQIFDHSGIERRHVCMPLAWYETPHEFAETNGLYVEHALRLITEASRRALHQAGLAAEDIDHVIVVSSTGVTAPSLDARLANVLPLRGDVRRTPIWGLGCAAGAAGLSHAAHFARAHPESRTLLVAVELCTLTFQRADIDPRNLVATSLFSDGAAAAIVAGSAVAGPGPRKAGGHNGNAAGPGIELLASHSRLWPDTLDVMGWDVDEHGLHVVFSRDIPDIVRRRVRVDLHGFLAEHGLTIAAIAHWVAHPGGPKVLDALAETLEVPVETFRHAREVLRTCGNMSSPTCLFVLERALAAGDFHPGDLGVVSALGPGFSAEYVLFRAT
jgi:alkylresorcinol/alkylpyrone synthase